MTDYLNDAGLTAYLNRLGFQTVGYGCTTCIGNSGPLPDAVADAVSKHDIVAAAVLSGNRNFEGRVHPLVKANYLASPPLVVAYAAGRTDRPRLDHRTPGSRKRRHAGIPQGHLAHRARNQRHRCSLRDRGQVQDAIRPGVRRQRKVEQDQRRRRRHLPMGCGQHLRAKPAVLREPHARRSTDSTHPRQRASWSWSGIR